MRYYETISTLSKEDLIKEAKKNIQKLEKEGMTYEKEIQHFLSKRFQIKSMELESMPGDILYLLNVQLDVILNKGCEKL